MLCPQKKIADGLKDLRNNASFGLIIVNLLWMAVNFMFQLTNAAKITLDSGHGEPVEVKGTFHLVVC